MSVDDDLFEEYLLAIADRYTAAELVELLDLDVWDVIEAFRDNLRDKHLAMDYDR